MISLLLAACHVLGGGGTYSIGGTVTGLSGTGLVLQDNGGDNLAITTNGSFTFKTLVANKGAYSVTILTQPSNPQQTCTVADGSGTATADVTSVTVTCPAAFTIGGTVTGLSGTGLVLQDNGGDNLTITANGSFTFKTPSTGAYAVTVLTQPINPQQLCTVANGSGTATANVTNVAVTCSTGFTIGGTVTGLSGTGLVLQDNGGDNLAITANGSFKFKTLVASAGAYAVTVLTQPTNPQQTCTVANGSGTASANVTNVQVTCGTGTVTIGGTVTGLSGTGLVLQDNGGDNLNVSANGVFTFATSLPVGKTYNVTVLTQPTNPSQDCRVAAGSGTASANVGNIVITCSAGTISIGGSVSGLAGSGLVLQNNSGDNLSITANGAFTFATLVVSGSSYNVTVFTQPSNPSQTCTVTNGSGTATANVTNIQIVCPAVFFSIGGQVIGLLGTGGGMVLQDNGGDNLPISGDGPFTFAAKIAYESTYDVTIFKGQDTQLQGCIVWGYEGTATANVTSVLVDCGHNDWTWMDGANTSNQYGTNSGTCGSTTTIDTNTPGGTRYPATWTDLSGNLWLFSGYGFSSDSTIPLQPSFFNEMWVYTGTQNYFGGYANCWTQVTPPAAPSARWGAVTWTDASGTLWLFGGQDGGTNFLNDLWSYNISTNTWTNIAGGANQNGVYGTQGTASASNLPGGRWGATARIDTLGNVWLFGGFGFDSTHTSPGLLNDLWEYSGGQWTWVSGSNLFNPDGVYGTQGTPASTNVPGGRQAAISWIDNLGNFWIFGGYNLSSSGQPDAFNDLWEFSGGQWTWVSGSNLVNQTGVYGTQGVAAASNVPGARWCSAAWTDYAGRLWLFGGQGYDATGNGSLADLWQFSGGQWTWVKGPNSVDQLGIYGIQANPVVWPHVVDYPGTRWAAGYWIWIDTSPLLLNPPIAPTTELWLFGGEGYDSAGINGNGLLNDLWRYLPYP
jgi:hypothetical protein